MLTGCSWLDIVRERARTRAEDGGRRDPPDTAAVAARGGTRPHDRRDRRAGGISGKARAFHPRLLARRRGRYPGAHRQRCSAKEVGPDHRDRKPGRRQRQHRGRVRLARAARRLHHRMGVERPYRDTEPAQAQLRRHQELRADHPGDAHARRAHRAVDVPGKDLAGIHRARPLQARRAELCQRGDRRGSIPRDGDADAADRHQTEPRPVQGRRRCGDVGADRQHAVPISA